MEMEEKGEEIGWKRVTNSDKKLMFSNFKVPL